MQHNIKMWNVGRTKGDSKLSVVGLLMKMNEMCCNDVVDWRNGHHELRRIENTSMRADTSLVMTAVNRRWRTETSRTNVAGPAQTKAAKTEIHHQTIKRCIEVDGVEHTCNIERKQYSCLLVFDVTDNVIMDSKQCRFSWMIDWFVVFQTSPNKCFFRSASLDHASTLMRRL